MSVASDHELRLILLKFSELWSFILVHVEKGACDVLIYSTYITWVDLPICRLYMHEFSQLQIENIKNICILHQ